MSKDDDYNDNTCYRPIREVVHTKIGARWYFRRAECNPPKGVDEIMNQSSPFASCGADFNPDPYWDNDWFYTYDDDLVY